MKKKSETVFTRSELVRFGRYLLSKERRDLFASSPEPSMPLEDRLSEVHHADVENFICLINEENHSPQKTPKPLGDYPVA